MSLYKGMIFVFSSGKLYGSYLNLSSPAVNLVFINKYKMGNLNLFLKIFLGIWKWISVEQRIAFSEKSIYLEAVKH
jgi:hypothetical protein